MVAAALLLLAAGCSNGGDTTRGTVPTATTTTSAPSTPTPTAGTPNTPTNTTPAPSATVTVTVDTTPTGTSTPTGTTTPVTVDNTTPPVIGTTETVTSTTGSGPTVPTTLPITDDTTTSTTEATGDDTEPRNTVDEQYPIGSDERAAYLNLSGGVAPAGATVTMVEFFDAKGQHGKTSQDRWPNGIPAPPGSPSYQHTTFEQRQSVRARQWVAAMNIIGKTPQDAPRVNLSDGTEYPQWWWYQTTLGEQHKPGLWTFRWDGDRSADDPPEELYADAYTHVCTADARGAVVQPGPELGTFTADCELLMDWGLWTLREVLVRPGVPQIALSHQYQMAQGATCRQFHSMVANVPRIPARLGQQDSRSLNHHETLLVGAYTRLTIWFGGAWIPGSPLNDADAPTAPFDAEVSCFADWAAGRLHPGADG